MPPYVVIEKRVGETPLQALEAYRTMHPELLGVPMTYAGRLDPMASGKLLILLGEECKHKDAYTKLDKEYEFEVLLGLQSDTGDVLGLAAACSTPESITVETVHAVSKALRGSHKLPYPLYSSKTVAGKPLFQHAHENNVVDLPISTMRVYSLQCIGEMRVSTQTLLEAIEQKIHLLQAERNNEHVGSDFRKGAILDRWKELLSNVGGEYRILCFRAAVGPGTYIRTLGSKIAEELGTCGLAYSIHRTKIGKHHSIGGFVSFWTQVK